MCNLSIALPFFPDFNSKIAHSPNPFLSLPSVAAYTLSLWAVDNIAFPSTAHCETFYSLTLTECQAHPITPSNCLLFAQNTHIHIFCSSQAPEQQSTFHSAPYPLAQWRPYVTLRSNLSNYVFSGISSCAFELVAVSQKKPGWHLAGYRFRMCTHTHTDTEGTSKSLWTNGIHR